MLPFTIFFGNENNHNCKVAPHYHTPTPMFDCCSLYFQYDRFQKVLLLSHQSTEYLSKGFVEYPVVSESSQSAWRFFSASFRWTGGLQRRQICSLLQSLVRPWSRQRLHPDVRWDGWQRGPVSAHEGNPNRIRSPQTSAHPQVCWEMRKRHSAKGQQHVPGEFPISQWVRLNLMKMVWQKPPSLLHRFSKLNSEILGLNQSWESGLTLDTTTAAWCVSDPRPESKHSRTMCACGAEWAGHVALLDTRHYSRHGQELKLGAWLHHYVSCRLYSHFWLTWRVEIMTNCWSVNFSAPWNNEKPWEWNRNLLWHSSVCHPLLRKQVTEAANFDAGWL